MRAYVDLHIHSALSPCSDNEMTPNNIANMAYLKGLNIIAVTDHNSVLNCQAVIDCAKNAGILALPGMELETSEEVHVVCIFPDMNEASSMQKMVWDTMPLIKNREDIFGMQLVVDNEDNIIKHHENLLLTACGLSIEEVFEIVTEMGGVVIPAHVDRDSYSIISNLGFVPENLPISYMEISKGCNLEDYSKRNTWATHYKFIKSSDAHYLGDILEKDTYLELDEISVECLIKTLRKG